MNTFKYRTNINCGSCVKSVSGFLNDESQIKKWEVDTENPDKVLTVETEQLNAEQIKNLVEEAGFDAELIS